MLTKFAICRYAMACHGKPWHAMASHGMPWHAMASLDRLGEPAGRRRGNRSAGPPEAFPLEKVRTPSGKPGWGTNHTIV